MCDYSLHAVASRDAKAGDLLISCRFPRTDTRGFCTKGDPLTAVCLRPGTELVFEGRNVRLKGFFSFWHTVGSNVARFRRVDTNKPTEHHDALEFSNGRIVKVTDLAKGQRVRVVQMPSVRVAKTSDVVATPPVRVRPGERV